jgi:hypothetical protein
VRPTKQFQLISTPFRLYTPAELALLPRPSWLVRGVVEVGALGFVYGAPGDGKTFAVLGLALAVATGTDWMGRRTKQGPVVYITGEGSRRLGTRVAAWERHHGGSATDFYVVRNPPQFRDARHREALISQITNRNLRPRLIIIDTLACSFVGGEENSAKEVGEFIHSLRALLDSFASSHRGGSFADEPFCTVLVVHHTGKSNAERQAEERGSSAIRGAAEMMIRVSKKGGLITITSRKQKDADDFEPITCRLHPVTDLGFDADGEPLTSCVLVPVDHERLVSAPPVWQAALQALKDLGGEARRSAWFEASRSRVPRLADRTFDAWREQMEAAGVVHRLVKGLYRLTSHEASASASVLQTSADCERFSSAAIPPTLEKGGVRQVGMCASAVEVDGDPVE